MAKITCSRCGGSFSEAEMSQATNASWCRQCKAAYMREYQKQNRQKMRDINLRWRERNREELNAKQLAAYHALSPEEKRERNDAQKAYWLKSKFGLTVPEYEAMAKAQGNRCAICHRPPPKHKRLGVDHNHKTTKVRALLCDQCNIGLNRFDDLEGWAEKATEYLKKYDG